MQFKTKVPTVDIKQGHMTQNRWCHTRGRGRLNLDMNVTKRSHQSVCVCVFVCVCVWCRNATDVAISTDLIYSYSGVKTKRERPPHLVTVQLKMGTW